MHILSAADGVLLVQRGANAKQKCVKRIAKGAARKASKIRQNKAGKFFSEPGAGGQGEPATRRAFRAERSYPLFLWITLCIRVRKRAVSESRCGFHPIWRESRLFRKII
ncbi:hypothetical protein SMX26_001731 [Cronobacter universalis]|nr:hypothetical protein [Cronobacter universalis]